jgi:CRISPR/Cas system-associated exonuclease Cas4 (RecB family)
MGKNAKSVYISRIAKIIAGECPFKIWNDMRTPKKDDSDDLRRWREDHDALVDHWSKKLREDGWIIVRERGIDCEGCWGRMDIIGMKDDHIKIWEIKTGKEYPSHDIQAALYCVMEKKLGNENVSAAVQYIDNCHEIDVRDYSGIWDEALKAKSMLLNDIPPEEKIPSGICTFCDMADDCEERLDII